MLCRLRLEEYQRKESFNLVYIVSMQYTLMSDRVEEPSAGLDKGK